MELEDFLRRYLPDYNNRERNSIHDFMSNKTLCRHERMIWNEKHFSEAFDNYSKKQREICSKALKGRLW